MKFSSCKLALVITGVAAFAQAQNAITSRLLLSQEEWRCLQPRLDQYLREPLDPVLASVLGCGQQGAHQETMRKDPILKPESDPHGDADAKRKVFFLTKGQIVCLKSVISSLIESGEKDAHGRIAYDLSGCPQ